MLAMTRVLISYSMRSTVSMIGVINKSKIEHYLSDLMEKVTSNEFKRKSGKFDLFMNDLDWFKYDTPIEKGFDEFCRRWWVKEGTKDELSDGSWSNYVTNDEWKRLEVMKNDPNQASQECIGE
ncbi:hypothetical protein Tco_0185149 [Tanacetum coccineum]